MIRRLRSISLLAVSLMFVGSLAFANGQKESQAATASTMSTSGTAQLLASTVHPPTFDDSKLFGLRDALYSAMKGKDLSKVNTWMVVNILATYWVAGKQGDAQAAKELGIKAQYEGPTQGQLSKQVSMYETLASTGANGLFTSVIDPTSEGRILNNAVDKGVNLVAIDSPVPSSVNALVYVGTPNYAAGQAAGEAMKKALPQGGEVAILTGSLTAPNALQRIAGFKAVLAGSNIQVATTQNDNGSAATASSNADSVIASMPNLKGLYGVYSYDGPAAAVAVKSKGEIGKIMVVADDTEPGTIAGLKDGTVAATIIQQPYMQGYLGAYITAAMEVLGKQAVTSIMQPFETGGVISTGVGTLTQANLAADESYNTEIGTGG